MKDKICQCGCGEIIEWKSFHKYYNIKYKNGHRARLGNNGTFRKNNIPWNKDKHGIYSKERLEQLRLQKLGLKLSNEQKNKISNSLKGKPKSKEHNLKNSLSKIGNTYGLGHKKSEEFKIAQSIRMKDYYKRGILKSRRQTEDSKLKISLGLKKMYNSEEWINNGKIKKSIKHKHTLSLPEMRPKIIMLAKLRRQKVILPLKDSKPEIKVQTFLKDLNIDFIKHRHMKEIEHAYQCDILIPALFMVIECDGNYWHKYPQGREIDFIRTKELEDQSYRVVRLWESDINNMKVEEFKNIILYNQ